MPRIPKITWGAVKTAFMQLKPEAQATIMKAIKELRHWGRKEIAMIPKIGKAKVGRRGLVAGLGAGTALGRLSKQKCPRGSKWNRKAGKCI